VPLSWSDWLKHWEETVYEPHFAPRGIEKGVALLSSQIQNLADVMRSLPAAQGEALKRAAKQMEEDGEMWRGPDNEP
jgi:hypothetical protein